MKKMLLPLLTAILTILSIGCATTQTTTSTATSLPTELTDYTVQMDYIWGVVEEYGKPPQVFVDDRIKILNVGPSEVSRKIMYVEAQLRYVQNPRVERVWLTFRRNVDYQKVQWHYIKESHDILAPLRDPILEKVRRGQAKPPMILAEVKFN